MFNNIKQIRNLSKQLKNLNPNDMDMSSLNEMAKQLGIDEDYLEKHTNDLFRYKHKLKFTKIHPDAVEPKYNYDTDSGFDLHSTEDVTLEPFGRALVSTGLRFDIPEGCEIQVRPKSGLALKQGITVLNTPGTVDSGYNGEVKVILYNSTQNSIEIKSGQKIAQACICPVVNGKWINLEETSEISEKDRGDNGFGSTGV